MALSRAIKIKAEHGAPAQKGFPQIRVFFPKETASRGVLPSITGLLAVSGAVTLHILLPDSAGPKAQSQDSSVSWKISELPLAEPSFATVPCESTELYKLLLHGVVQGAWKWSQKVQLGREEAFQRANIQHLASISF